ncbi:MAG: SRPBCC domain-containing protein [Bradyrhizobium sp.]
MKIEKQFAVAAAQDRVWAFITNPSLIGPCIPGCKDVEVLAPGRYRASLQVQVGPIKTTFAGIVEARVERPPEYAEYALQGEEGGKASRLSAVSTLAIARLTDTECEVRYSSEVNVVGRLGKFGAGVMQKIADNLGEKFAKALRAALEEERAEG